MKVAYSNIVNRLKSKPSIENISKKLLQLGHENTVSNNIIDIEFTPNRGDCLSINGLLRDLSVFYQTNNQPKIYEKDIDPLDIKFQNDDILVDHSVLSFPDGSKEAVLACHMKKEGKIISTETGATPLSN